MSARKGSDTEGSGHSGHSKKSKASERGNGSGRRDGRGGRKDIGRALRSAYDDTLREPVPDDFVKLIGKLT
ncbi:MAG TPA: NepR family anti-sigma factor [Sphingomicrobium sp.]|nr:NepR family anti-sigma factor [Sphingomicrobium sp.]HET7575566.1 NepR family anti-sigma factor [Sphingomicrobium sp.]